MASFKVRRLLNATGGIRVDETGDALAKILTGSIATCVVATNAGLSSSGSAQIASVAAGDIVFASKPDDVNTASLVLVSTSATAASTVVFRWYNPGTGNTSASTLTMRYMILGK